MSLALGAFLAGLILSESDYGHQALASLIPFRDVFLSIFFMSVGMPLDLGVVASSPLPVLGGAAAVFVAKAVLAVVAGLAVRLPVRGAAQAITLIVRTRYATETHELLDGGADEVVPEEFETSVEIFSRVLRHFLVDESRGVALRAELRVGAYGFIRDPEAVAEPGGMRLPVPETEIRTFAVEPGSSLAGRARD